MRVLLTGAAGWLGRHLKPRLEARGCAVVGLDIAPSPWTDVQGSAADRPLLARLFREHGFEAVVHAGALHKPDIARYPAQAFVDANVAGTLNLLEEATAVRARFVFTSTTSLMISPGDPRRGGRRPPSGSMRASGRSRRATSMASPSSRPRGSAASPISNTGCLA